MHGVNRIQACARRLTSIACVLSFALALGCGSGESTSPEGSPPSTPSDTAESAMPEISAEAQRCLDLVRSESYAEAIDPCQRAVASGAGAEVETALATAKAAAMEAGSPASQDAAGALQALAEPEDR